MALVERREVVDGVIWSVVILFGVFMIVLIIDALIGDEDE